MKLHERRALESALQEYYRAGEGGGCAEEGAPRAVVRTVAEELARPIRPRAAAVLASQAHHIGAATWALHAVIVLLAALLVLSGVRIAPGAGALSAALAVASLAELTRSRSCGMVELEAACVVNAQAIVCARAIVLGCTDAALMLLLTALTAIGPTVWLMVAQICAPYLLAAGAGLCAARRASSADATVAAGAAATGVCAACVILRVLWPAAFAPAAGAAWALAALLAFAFALFEMRAWIRAAASAFADAPACVRAY